MTRAGDSSSLTCSAEPGCRHFRHRGHVELRTKLQIKQVFCISRDRRHIRGQKAFHVCRRPPAAETRHRTFETVDPSIFRRRWVLPGHIRCRVSTFRRCERSRRGSDVSWVKSVVARSSIEVLARKILEESDDFPGHKGRLLGKDRMPAVGELHITGSLTQRRSKSPSDARRSQDIVQRLQDQERACSCIPPFARI